MTNSVYSTHKPKSGSGLYLRVNDGETVRVRIVSEPAIYESKGQREGKETLTTRYAWLIYNQNDKKVQIMQQSGTFFKSIAALAQDDEWGDPRQYDIKVTREGASFNDTTYTVTASPNRTPLDTSILDQVDAIDLLEKIELSPFTTRVYWLADFEAMEEEGAKPQVGDAVGSSGYDRARAQAKAIGKRAPTAAEDETYDREVDKKMEEEEKNKTDDMVIKDISDDPINLDDIPF